MLKMYVVVIYLTLGWVWNNLINIKCFLTCFKFVTNFFCALKTLCETM
jgi:hypothetical protein